MWDIPRIEVMANTSLPDYESQQFLLNSVAEIIRYLERYYITKDKTYLRSLAKKKNIELYFYIDNKLNNKPFSFGILTNIDIDNLISLNSQLLVAIKENNFSLIGDLIQTAKSIYLSRSYR